jgi:hypothetical protein
LAEELAGKKRQKHSFLEKRAKKAAALQLFVKQVGRKASPGYDPNDRHYDRDVEQMARRLPPTELDALLRDGEED